MMQEVFLAVRRAAGAACPHGPLRGRFAAETGRRRGTGGEAGSAAVDEATRRPQRPSSRDRAGRPWGDVAGGRWGVGEGAAVAETWLGAAAEVDIPWPRGTRSSASAKDRGKRGRRGVGGGHDARARLLVPTGARAAASAVAVAAGWQGRHAGAG